MVPVLIVVIHVYTYYTHKYIHVATSLKNFKREVGIDIKGKEISSKLLF